MQCASENFFNEVKLKLNVLTFVGTLYSKYLAINRCQKIIILFITYYGTIRQNEN